MVVRRRVCPYSRLAVLVALSIMVTMLLLSCTEPPPHQYSPKTLAFVEWGAVPGKFGLRILPEGELAGPRTFAVAPDGRIFVLDSVKHNVKIFDRNGTFEVSVGRKLPGYSLAVHRDQIFLLDGESVYRYDILGELTAKCPISVDIALFEGYGQWMRVDDLGNLYVKNSRGTYRICTGVDTPTPLLETKQLQTERQGSPNAAGNRWFRLRKISKQQFQLGVSYNSGVLQKTIPIDTVDTFGRILFLDQDDHGYIYLESQRITRDNVVHQEVRKYSPNGNLAVVLDISGRYHTVVYKKVAVDRHGDIYQLLTLPEGVKIVRWEQVR